MSSSFDVIVVGAGPGGSNAAKVALDGGLRILQIDASRFPRVKPCAGGVTLKAARALAHELAPTLRRTFNDVEFNVWGKRINRFVDRRSVVHMVCRPEFDNDLIAQNRRHRRFTFIDGQRVDTVAHADGAFTVHTPIGTFSAPQLVAPMARIAS